MVRALILSLLWRTHAGALKQNGFNSSYSCLGWSSIKFLDLRDFQFRKAGDRARIHGIDQ